MPCRIAPNDSVAHLADDTFIIGSLFMVTIFFFAAKVILSGRWGHTGASVAGISNRGCSRYAKISLVIAEEVPRN